MNKCRHTNIVNPPAGKYLRICLDCVKRLLECDTCDSKAAAGTEETEGWTKYGQILPHEVTTFYACPSCTTAREQR